MVSDPLKELIWTKSSDYSYECHVAQLEAKSKIKELRKQSTKDVAKELRARLPESSRKAMDLASERGAFASTVRDRARAHTCMRSRVCELHLKRIK